MGRVRILKASSFARARAWRPGSGQEFSPALFAMLLLRIQRFTVVDLGAVRADVSHNVN